MKFPRIFGRNQSESAGLEEWKVSNYPLEAERVLEAVTNPSETLCIWETNPDPLGEYKAWMPFMSIFQQTDYESQYGDIVVELSRIESKVVFSDR